MPRFPLLPGCVLFAAGLALAQTTPSPFSLNVQAAPIPVPSPPPPPPPPPAPTPAPAPSPTPAPTPAPSPAPSPTPGTPPTPAPTPAPGAPADPRKADTPGPATPAGGAAPAPTPTPTPTPGPKSIDDLVKGYEVIPGLWKLYRKVENNRQRYLAELTQDQLSRAYMLQSTFATGNSARISAGRPVRDVVFTWKKTPDDRLILSSPNLWARAKDPDVAGAVHRDFPNAFLGIYPILGRQKERNTVLIDISPLWDGSVNGLSSTFEPTPGTPGGYALDPALTYVDRLKNFPINMVAEVQYHFRGSARNQSAASPAQTDPRSLPVRVVYNLYYVPQDGDGPGGFRPRLADPRIGYFINGQISAGRVGFSSFDDDTDPDPAVRYINRWRLEKADPNAALSPPVKPIRFLLDTSIPKQYRQAVREGILMWNQAFEPLGFRNAVEVGDVPTDKDFDHADMRYNVIRWVASSPTDSSAGAVALLRENPLTGEMLNGSINVSSNFARFAFREKKEIVNPLEDVRKRAGREAAATENWNGVACELDDHFAEMAAWGREAAQAQRIPLNDARYVNDFLRALVAHEFGHILGLRHNFLASTYHSPAALADLAHVRKHGVSASVMDYVGFNVFGLKTGADLFSRAPGKYDRWAIEYGYRPVPAEREKQVLQQIAGRANESGLAFETDGAADGYDPTIVRYDLSSDPLAYAERDFEVNRQLLNTLLARYPRQGETYAQFTRRVRSFLGSNMRSASITTNYVGGAYLRRAVRGDKGEKRPYVPVSAQDQRRALDILARNVFAPNVMRIPPQYNYLMAPDPYAFTDASMNQGFPIRDTINSLRARVLLDLLSAERLRRIANNEYKFPQPGATLPLLELFPRVRTAIWGPVTAKTVVPAQQRDLQRVHLNHLLQLAANKVSGAPADARAVAENELRTLKKQLGPARLGSPDAYTRLHFAEALRKIDTVLRDKLQ